MSNFLEDTISALEQEEKEPKDVVFVANMNINNRFRCTWEDFAKNANFGYDPHASFTDIDEDLIIVGDNWWFEWERHKTGFHCWEFKTMPVKEELKHRKKLTEYDFLNMYKHVKPYQPGTGIKAKDIKDESDLLGDLIRERDSKNE
jgi:hypothetical protein